VTMRVDKVGGGVLRAEGEIVGDGGAPVGHRTFDRKAHDCSGLARAISVWASLVLDAEESRPRQARMEAQSPGTDEAGGATEANAGPDGEAKAREPADPVGTETLPDLPLPQAGDKPMLDREAPARREGDAVELGAGAFLMTGTGGGLLVGTTPFVVIEVAKGVFVRPALMFGKTLPSTEADVTLAATRFDGCLRIAGAYSTRHGMQVDFCGGADLGMLLTSAGRTLPYLALGPSTDLRGELGGDLAVLLRGLFGINAVHENSLDTPLWAGRVELAMSWRIR
jgi:hypothetical protein